MLQSCVQEFLFFLETLHLRSINEVKGPHILAYQAYIRERPNQRLPGGLSESMIRHHIFSLRLLFDFLLALGEIDHSPVRNSKFQFGKHKERSICTVEEIKEIYNACTLQKERALIGIAYGCGLRRTEIQNLNITDIHFHRGFLVVREGKNQKSRSIPMPNQTILDIKKYIYDERMGEVNPIRKDHINALFLNSCGRRMNGNKLNLMIQESIRKTENPNLKEKKLSLHCFRHSIATHLTDNGASLEFIQQLLGHSSIDTAHIYAKRRKQQMKVMNQ
jgi:site-specific recombinase XerD